MVEKMDGIVQDARIIKMTNSKKYNEEKNSKSDLEVEKIYSARAILDKALDDYNKVAYELGCPTLVLTEDGWLPSSNCW
jgi:hypothetical protein